MAYFVRQSILAGFFAMALFSTSCEKHAVGQMPEVQREQPDPAKEWSNGAGEHSEEHSTSGTPAESQHDAR
jgi:hypothetical protein